MTSDVTSPIPISSIAAPIPMSISLPAPSRQATTARRPLTLRIGFDMHLELTGAATPLLLMLYVHPEVAPHLRDPDRLAVEPLRTDAGTGVVTGPDADAAPVAVEDLLDGFGNRFARVTAPRGLLRLACDAIFRGTYEPEPQPDPAAKQHGAGELPPEALPFLLGSRYCEVDRLSAVAWDLFGRLPAGGARALAVNQWVFKHVRFGYRLTRPNKTALDTYVERTGVCRDMTHLAITFCRALNIPARYATGYLGDIDADPDPTPMDFSAYYEVYLDGRWWPMDARHGRARVGRVLMARGRDATDVALITSFGPHRLRKFTVVTDAVAETLAMPPAPQPAPLALSA